MGDEKATNGEAPEDVVEPTSPDVQFKPVIELPEMIPIQSLEEDEEELFRMRSKLYRLDRDADPPEWKERGLGDLRILFHPKRNSYRIVMRREQTFKICANHVLKPGMSLLPMSGSDKAFVWFTAADFADDEVTPETLAARFKSAENAEAFKDVFETAVKEAEKTASAGDEESAPAEEKENERPEKDEEEKEGKGGREKEEKEVKTEVESAEDSSPKDKKLIETVASDLDKLSVKTD